ncbi:hypothetical protein [Actinomadura rayongensis]|uniref:ParA family protein n=1 Tax=Actinomadura rayongensis TaxID=1429076 RepID=A0A6I4W629_9ACTN|nr:hypothetical protein [Actinomadura rayongensis]MXQ65627.1 hypothetical protein [Actinomadura rayongensis]
MAMIAVTSPGGAPGATTTALAWTLAWPREALLVECSPGGGTIVPGFFRGQLPRDLAQRGLWNVNLAVVENGLAGASHTFGEQVVELHAQPQRLLLPGLTDPFLAPQLSPSWPMLSKLFKGLPYDVLVDVGPLGPQAPFSLLADADLVMLVMRPTLAQTAAAVPRLENLRRALGPTADLGLCVIGSANPHVRDALNYSVEDVRRQLGEIGVTLTVADDPKSAGRLSDGLAGPRNIELAPLMRDVRRTVDILDKHVATKMRQLAVSSRDDTARRVPSDLAQGGAR